MMEENRLLDVPITNQEIRQRLDDRQRLLTENESTHARNDEIDPVLGRFRSLRASVQSSINRPVHTVRLVNDHQPLPSDEDNEPSDELTRNVKFDQPTAYTREVTPEHVEYIPKLWMPLWLRRSSLGLFLIFFLIIIIALVLLRHYSETLNGFNISSQSTQYAWTYAPVAFMVILVGLWRQVDYYCKLLVPWDNLRKGPIPASQSLLLDYVSPINLISFVSALKRGDAAVLLSVTGFFILKVMTIFSAALFVSLPVIVSSPNSATSSEIFAAPSLDAALSPNSSLFSASPVYATIGNIAYGLPFESGVKQNYAYIPVTPDQSSLKDLKYANYTFQTNAFFPDLSCQPFQVTLNGNTSTQANRSSVGRTDRHLTLKLPDRDVCTTWNRTQVYAMNPQREVTPRRQLEGTMQRVYCTNDGEEGSEELEPAGLLFTVTDIRYTQNIFQNGTIANSTRTLSSMSNVLCMPSYYQLTANITNNTMLNEAAGVAINISSVQNKTLKGLSNKNLAVLFDGVMNASQGIFGLRRDDKQAPEIPSTIFGLMKMVANQTSLKPFLDPSVMKTAAETTFQRVVSHYAAQHLVQPSQNTVNINVIHTEEKLRVSLVPYYVMLVGSALMALCAGMLAALAPQAVAPKDPSIIATSAVILARSPELGRLLKRKQAPSIAALADDLNGSEFGSAIAVTEQGHNSFKVVAFDTHSRPVTSRNAGSHQWWSPNGGFLLPTLVLAAVCLLGLIAALEVLQHRSENDQGIVTVSMSNWTNLYIRCIPVLVLLIVAAMVSFIDFYVELFATWNKLSRGHAGSRQALLSHLLGKLPPAAFTDAIKSRHYGATFSISAAVVASLFAIIASNLYSVQQFTTTGPSQQLTRDDVFALQAPYNVLDDQGAAGMLQMIATSNLASPQGVLNDLVLPEYSISKTQDQSTKPVGLIVGPFTANVSALRGNLQCDTVSSQNIDIRYLPSTPAYINDSYRVDTSYDLPSTCQLAGKNQSLPTINFQSRFNITNNDTTLVGGKLYDLLFGTNASLVNNYGETKPAQVGDNPAVGCPSLAFTLAEFSSSTSTFRAISLVCYQQVQQMTVNVTFQPNSTVVDQSLSPTIDNTTISILKNPNSTTGSSTFDWRIQHNIQRQLYGLSGDRLQSKDSTTTYDFDAFFSFLFNNTIKADPTTLTDPTKSRTLFDAVNTVYRAYVAQVINANTRQTTTSSKESLVIRQSSSSDPAEMQTRLIRPRLVQNNVSKLILQVLLGIAALTCLAGYLLTKFHRLLPLNPCSIAGTMSLLAGSDLCWTPDEELCDCCGKPRRSSFYSDENFNSNYHETIHAERSEYDNDHQFPSTPSNLAREQIIPEGAEWMHYTKYRAVFANRMYSLGWWREDRTKARRRRFGIDAGARPDGEADDDWELGDRRPVGDQGFEGFMMRGRDMMFGGLGPDPSSDNDGRGAYQRADGAGVESDIAMTNQQHSHYHTTPNTNDDHGAYNGNYDHGYDVDRRTSEPWTNTNPDNPDLAINPRTGRDMPTRQLHGAFEDSGGNEHLTSEHHPSHRTNIPRVRFQD